MFSDEALPENRAFEPKYGPDPDFAVLLGGCPEELVF
jgi:hypothetical protein